MAESSGGILTVRNKGGVGPGRSLGQHPGISAGAEGRTPWGGWESWEPRGTKLGGMTLERAGAQPGLRAAVERWRPGLRTGGEPRCGTAGAGPAGAARPPRCVRPTTEAGADRPFHLPAGPEWWRQHGDRSRGSLDSSLSQMQHRLHHVGAVLGAGLAEQAAVGLGLAVGVSRALVSPGTLRSCCSPWPVAARGLCGPLWPGHATGPSCFLPASMAVTARCPAG